MRVTSRVLCNLGLNETGNLAKVSLDSGNSSAGEAVDLSEQRQDRV